MYLIVYKDRKTNNDKFICDEITYNNNHKNKEIFSVEDSIEEAQFVLRNWKDDILELNAE
jgi:hypothetical protein